MPTVLDTPQIIKQITHATVDEWMLAIVRVPGNVQVDPARSSFSATVNLRDGSGEVVSRQQLTVAGPQLPASLVTAIRTFHTAVVAALRDAGKLPAGTDSQDI